MNPVKYHHAAVIVGVLWFIAGILTGCTATTIDRDDIRQIEGLMLEAPSDADNFIIVDCVLPGQIRQLGTGVIYIARGPSESLPAGECARRGGRFALPGQTGYDKALLVWMPQARDGNRIAQNYVGEIYQRGSGGKPRYDLAAEWYRKAAEQGLPQAQMNLAHLYNKGLGVEKDPRQAQYWFRRATGLGEAVALDQNALSIEEREELKKLRKEVRRRSRESRQLEQQLEQSRKELEEINRKLEQLKRQPESQKQREDVNKLIAATEQHKQEIEDLIKQLAHYQKLWSELPPPRIEVADDAPVTMRGVSYDAGRETANKRIIAGTVYAPAGLASFTFNRQSPQIQPDGKFRVSVSLNPSGDTEVLLVAVDRRGISTTVRHKLFISTAGPPKANFDLAVYKTVDYGRYHALIVGNVDYKWLPDLKTAINDAKAVEEILRNKYGFKTQLLLDASRYDILESLNHFNRVLTQKDNLLIYYAGHGKMDPENHWGYWQPVDADENSTTN